MPNIRSNNNYMNDKYIWISLIGLAGLLAGVWVGGYENGKAVNSAQA